MKRVVAIILALTMLFALAACGGTSSSAPASPAAVPQAPAEKANAETAEPAAEATVINLKFVHQWKSDSRQQNDQFEGYFKLLEEKLGGAYDFQIDYYPTGTLLSGPDIYQGVVDGVVDIGATTPAFFTDRYVAWNSILIPGVMSRKTAAACGRIDQAFFDKYQMAEMDDVKLLFAFGGVTSMIHSTKPIHTLEDLKGLTVRTAGTSATIINALGAIPISMDYGEVLSSAQKGLIDACWGTAEDLENYNLAEVFPYSTYVEEMGGNVLYVIMNKGNYEKLPQEVKDAMEEITWDAVALSGAIWDYQADESAKWAVETYKHEFITRTDEEAARWDELIANMKADYQAKLDAAGYPGAEMMETLAELTEKYDTIEYNKWTPDAGTSFDPGVLKVE